MMSQNNHTYKKVLAEVVELFDGNTDAAETWLQTPQLGLKFKKPIELLDTNEGTETVLTLVRQIDHGVLS